MDRILLGLSAVTLIGYLLLGFYRPGVALNGLSMTADMFVQAVPWIVVSMFAAGLLAQFLHPGLIARWLGREAGVGGVVLGALLGMLGTGSRWAMYPLATGLLAAEASPGSVFAFVTTWQLVSLTRLPAEVPFYGAKFTIVRAVMSVFIAIIGGMLLEHIEI
ncbi:hypothetical protein [Alicyclobacillus sp. SO9]|uniref:hypothetical protein n=1 Tax=Alicyclobacillus sp. SO9 TaxID=2665646 RepID=UPI0018E7C5B0|nr:hypothetical protein [Alicyclobacillus sp. SO9]QQE80110.1 hypothetical protein GI364_06645 [Alicyclobacillus sp. SO9]